MKYTPIIGMEVHLQLKTKSKMFCSCSNESEKLPPNTTICPICVGHPGTLPVINKKAVEYTIKAALALNCQINQFSKFDRKNYFYPDLPKAYQISQYDLPIGQNGYLDIEVDGKTKRINIKRIHLEEDTAKTNHINGASLIDYNRSSSPLVELVTEPDVRSAKEARIFCQELQKIFRYLEISDADMEKGHMRCEANISLATIDKNENLIFGTKVEIKNLNSFKSVERAVTYEIKRQTKLLDKGEKIIQETRGWNEGKQITVSQRKKETSADYRYFPDPDLPPMRFVYEQTNDNNPNVINIRKIEVEMPELPQAKNQRFQEEYLLEKDIANILTNDKNIANYAEQIFSELEEWVKNFVTAKKLPTNDWDKHKKDLFRSAGNWITSKLFKLLDDSKQNITDIKITPENFAELIAMLHKGDINSSAAQKILEKMFKDGGDPSQITEELNLKQITDINTINEFVDQVIQKFPDQVQQYKNGKLNVFQFLLGQIMAISKGKADPKIAKNVLDEKLHKK